MLHTKNRLRAITFASALILAASALSAIVTLGLIVPDMGLFPRGNGTL